MRRKPRKPTWIAVCVVASVLVAAVVSLGIVEIRPDSCAPEGWPLDDGRCVPDSCSPIEYHDTVAHKFNFVVSFYGIDPGVIETVGYDLARANFYRSQYLDRIDESVFGFSASTSAALTPWERVGLFELEPFKSAVDKFNVFYIPHNAPTPDDRNLTFFYEHCPFLADQSPGMDFQPVLLQQKGPAEIHQTVFALASAPSFFNQRIGALWGLAYEGSNWLLRQQQSWPVEENEQAANCDYGHPSEAADYETGVGYCTAWCKGVNEDYVRYRDARMNYDACVQALRDPGDQSAWLALCTHTLAFDRYEAAHGVLPPILGTEGWLSPSSQEDACRSVYQVAQQDPASMRTRYAVQRFCDQGSLAQVEELDLGAACQAGTGCFPGCHDRADAFRPTRFGIMHSTHRLDVVPALADIQPDFGAWEIQLLREHLAALELK